MRGTSSAPSPLTRAIQNLEHLMSICFELPIYLILIGRLSMRDSTRIDVGRWTTCFSMLRQSNLRLEIFEDENFYTYIRVSSAALKDRAGSLNRPLLLYLVCFVHSLARMVRRFFSFLSQFDANNSVVFLNSWGGEIVNRLTRLKGIESFRSTVRPVEEKENVRRIDCTARAQSRLLGHGAYTCKG